ncbi:polysaccharide pyruvyl transferase family protein [Thalassospira lucentensis]|uniref:polysaccharide pyruvyl transferase family protein n=1 Tax=Thalassospira lucentensis TaxID=168935 RepID=UPI003D2A6BEA
MIASSYHLIGTISLGRITEFSLEAVQSSAILSQENPSEFAVLLNADVIVCNGEGTLHGDGELPRKLLKLLRLLSSEMGKELVMCNQSVYPDDHVLVESGQQFEYYQKCMSSVSYVTGRELRTFKQLQKLDLNPTLSFDSLPLFLRDGLAYSPSEQKEKLFLVSGSSTWERSLAKPVANVLRRLLDDGYTLVFVDGAKANATQKEFKCFQDIKSYVPELQYCFANSLDEWICLFDRASGILTGRYHHLIAAYSAKTPIILFDGITPRLPGTCEMLKLPQPIKVNSASFEADLVARYDSYRSGELGKQRLNDAEWNALIDLAKNNLPMGMSSSVLARNMQKLSGLTVRTWIDRLSDRRELLRFDIKRPQKSFCEIFRKIGRMLKVRR